MWGFRAPTTLNAVLQCRAVQPTQHIRCQSGQRVRLCSFEFPYGGGVVPSISSRMLKLYRDLTPTDRVSRVSIVCTVLQHVVAISRPLSQLTAPAQPAGNCYSRPVRVSERAQPWRLRLESNPLPASVALTWAACAVQMFQTIENVLLVVLSVWTGWSFLQMKRKGQPPPPAAPSTPGPRPLQSTNG